MADSASRGENFVCLLARPTSAAHVGIVPFFKALSRLFLMLRDDPGEDPGPLGRAVAVLRGSALFGGTALEASAHRCLVVSPFTPSGALLLPGSKHVNH